MQSSGFANQHLRVNCRVCQTQLATSKGGSSEAQVAAWYKLLLFTRVDQKWIGNQGSASGLVRIKHVSKQQRQETNRHVVRAILKMTDPNN